MIMMLVHFVRKSMRKISTVYCLLLTSVCGKRENSFFPSRLLSLPSLCCLDIAAIKMPFLVRAEFVSVMPVMAALAVKKRQCMVTQRLDAGQQSNVGTKANFMNRMDEHTVVVKVDVVVGEKEITRGNGCGNMTESV
jgi:hypothetical protein